ncbi:MAG: restriction endonuclease subunit S [Verrucomicrobia bacterium]|nr:MAG: restriction endonuclease subunit S [Verrucomicrobiota bacterium]TAE87858.1 MAG: restriction endonuclease subunit S [Verrucomicrobiota bacterium]TAF25601.1 MAG: restriction endonuclease subunit S [Verrucomicrobiota bacterium]TAF41332.1 MAG: restriction endonuclease subunit S [Verrucomicrobiota bacterium]
MISRWKSTALSKVAVIERSAIQPAEIEEGTPYLGLEHIESGGKILGAKPVDAGELASSKFRFSAKHVLYGKLRPYLAKITCPDFTGICSTDILPILPGSNLDRRFLCYFLRQPSMVEYANSRTSGANLPRLSPTALAEIEIPLPPLAEQKRIAGILDAADALRAKRRESLAQLDSLLQSTFLTLFGDPVSNPTHPTMSIEESVGRIIDYRGKSPDKTPSGIPLITAKIVKNKGVDEPSEFIATEAYESWMRRGIPSPQDVIITTEAPMGEVALVPDYKAAFAQRLLVLQPKRDLLEPIYLMWALTMPFATRQMDQRSTGSTVTGIRSKEFRKVAIPLPPLPLQRRFAAIVESVERQKAQQRAHLAELDALFASLQHRAFRGEL